MKNKLVRGVGVYGAGEYVSYLDGEITREYSVWSGMLARCYDPRKTLTNPTYAGCTVSETFKNFQKFSTWANKQVGYGRAGWHLDKDLLVLGNKVYGEGSCLFIPREINQLIISCKSSRGEWPVGVSFCKQTGRFQATINLGACGKRLGLGRFETPELAFVAYKQAKEQFIKQRAEEFKHQIDERAYAALMAYQVNIDD